MRFLSRSRFLITKKQVGINNFVNWSHSQNLLCGVRKVNWVKYTVCFASYKKTPSLKAKCDNNKKRGIEIWKQIAETSA